MSKFSSFKEHQLITENWRRFLAEEGPPADPQSAAEEALSTMSPEEIIMQAAQLPPEVQKQIEATAETAAPKLAQQSSMTNEADEIEPLSPAGRKMRRTLKGGAAAGAAVGIVPGLQTFANYLKDPSPVRHWTKSLGDLAAGATPETLWIHPEMVTELDILTALAGPVAGVAIAAALIIALAATGLAFREPDDEE